MVKIRNWKSSCQNLQIFSYLLNLIQYFLYTKLYFLIQTLFIQNLSSTFILVSNQVLTNRKGKGVSNQVITDLLKPKVQQRIYLTFYFLLFTILYFINGFFYIFSGKPNELRFFRNIQRTFPQGSNYWGTNLSQVEMAFPFRHNQKGSKIFPKKST